MDKDVYRALMPGLRTIAREAGAAIMACYNRDVQQWQKADESPLTEADLAAHKVIVAGLAELTPDIPVLSEESADIAWSERRQWSRYWLVDPLDGTKEFIKRNGEFTVNIALIEAHQPVMAVVYAPVLDKLYFADEVDGAWLQQGEDAPRALAARAGKDPSRIRLVGSRSHPSPAMQAFAGQFAAVDIVPMGSSLKLCLVAEGLADCYPRLGPTMEWDTAAGDCIARNAGARVTELDGQVLRYNARESLLNPFFVVARDDLAWQPPTEPSA